MVGCRVVALSRREDMTAADIRHRIEFMRSIGREMVPVPIATLEKLMATRIGKATVKDGKIKPIRKQSASQRAAGNKKAARVVKGLKANRSALKAKGK
jgi:hypothetical protein